MPSRPFRLALSLVALGLASTANAQDLPRSTDADPRLWLSASVGPLSYPQLNFLNNTSRENAGSAMALRGALEFDIGKVGSLGVTVSSSQFDVRYVTIQQNDPCVGGCDATLKATSVLATLRVGGGIGVEQLFEASAGLTMFGDLESSQPLLRAREASSDFTAAIAYGVTYGFTSQLSAMLVADLGLVFHDNPNDQIDITGSSYSHFLGIRAGLRYGLWNR